MIPCRTHHLHNFTEVALAILLACVPSIAQAKQATEPPLVGTVVFRTPSNHDKLDINSASKRQISSLPGMAAYADRIIAGRPYSTKLDLVKRGIVPQSAYDKVKGRIIAHRVRLAKTRTSTSATPASKSK